MDIFTTIEQTRTQIKKWQQQKETIGFVPTMGYLHEGHLSLIEKASSENDHVVVSIFVNPKQFGANEDLGTYPRDLARDAELCEQAGVEIIFNPDELEMYPTGFSTSIGMSNLTDNLCGKSRPNHFQGVCTVVNKLFNIVQPTNAYFGQKDAQQLAVIKRMVRDLNIEINVVGCPIIREADGLAKSSRNTYLSDEERQAALILSKGLKAAKEQIRSGERKAQVIISDMQKIIQSEPLAKIDYIEIVDATEIKQLEELNGDVLIAIAVYIGKTRLIDNLVINL